MEIYLVRHTTPLIEKGICYGQTDLDTTDEFDKESKIILDKIPLSNNSMVYSSPLKRCTKLAALFSKNFITDNRILELNFGDWELKKWNDIPSEEIDPWMKNFVHETVPNGESYIDLNTRVSQFYDALLKTKQEQIIVVTHGGVIRSLLAQLTRTPLEKSFDIKVIYGQISKITINETTLVTTAI